MVIFFVWILNFVISWVNAWGAGKTWNETKFAGGVPHFMNWCAAIMSAAGFTWCYLVVLGLGGAYIPFEQDDGTMAPLLTPEQLSVFFDLGYLVIIFPILGTGLAITIHSWGHFWRRRTFGSGAVAGYNTFAQVYNIVGALRHVPKAGSNVFSFFFGGKGDDKGKGIVLLLVVLAVAGGVLTTWAILTRTAKATARSRAFRYEMGDA
jgi:hypothetical protein